MTKNKIHEKLIGKTIKRAYLKGHSENCDSINVLVIEMNDGSIFEIEGGYGGYTGKSCDEYIETIDIREKVREEDEAK